MNKRSGITLIRFSIQIADQTICDNDSISISLVVADSYLWEPNSFIDNNTSQNPVFNPSVTTNTVFTGTNSFGCFIKKIPSQIL